VDVATWLRQLGLGRYEQIFRDAEITADVLPALEEGDLERLGLPLGPRKKLIRAIAELEIASSQSLSTQGSGVASQSEAERRHLTVMFVDLVESTALSANFDPEDMREVIRAYQNGVAGVIARFQGHVAKFMGDGVLAYFGWPRAHEDEAERAVRAGLAVTHAISHLRTRAKKPLQTRIGIATGLVVVGDLIGEGAAQEEAVVGDTPNLAARLQAAAKPGQVFIAPATRQLLGDQFELVKLRALQIRGLVAPIEPFAVLGERTHETRFAARGESAVLPLVGRDQELALLLERWRMARAGEGQLVLLTGEAGIGKSRITRALIDALSTEPYSHITLQASPYHGDSALYPTIRQLTYAAGFTPGESTESRLDKLEALLGLCVDDVRAVAPLIAALLEVDGATRYGPLHLSPQQQRSRTLGALVDQVVGLAKHQPVLLLIEDAQWIDPTSPELIELLLELIGAARVLILVTARPGFRAPFGGHPIVSRLTLNRLGRDATGAIISRITGERSLPEGLQAVITARTDGVPLFVEELTKTVIESGALQRTQDAYVFGDQPQALVIPNSLHDSLMARLDRLQTSKQVARTAAVIGREFEHRLLEAITPLPADELEKPSTS
jgi:class 3 adenylate cyclase